MSANAITNTKRAAERLLVSINSTPTAFEGVTFTAPAGLYQRCQFVVSPPTDPVLAPGYHRENIQFQVFVVNDKGVGTMELYEQAGKIRDAFYKGKTMIEQGTQIRILRTAQIASVIPLQENLIMPVFIQLSVDEYKN